MENASKALIIAGSILISIVIISLGIMVVNNARQTVGQSDMSDSEVQAFNGKFSGYIGTNKTASEVYSLIDAVQSNNQSEFANGSARFVEVICPAVGAVAATTYGQQYTNTAQPVAKSIFRLPTSHTYKVEVTAFNGAAYTGITVTQNP